MTVNDAKELLKDYDLAEALKTNEPHDIIAEIADSQVDIYNSDLLEWVGKGDYTGRNYIYVENAINEFGFPERDGKPDFIKAIMQGQYLANEEVLWAAWDELKQEYEKRPKTVLSLADCPDLIGTDEKTESKEVNKTMYFVKTRNWHCKRWVKFCLDISHVWGVKRGDNYQDGDGKYILLTSSRLKAILTWEYFMLLSEFSGGWTYVQHEGEFIRNSDPECA